jgi:hypothetical protein
VDEVGIGVVEGAHEPTSFWAVVKDDRDQPVVRVNAIIVPDIQTDFSAAPMVYVGDPLNPR